MAHDRLVNALLCSPLLLASACTSALTDVDDEQVGIVEEAVLSSNRLTMNRLTMNRLTMNSLSLGRLSPDGLHVAQTDLIKDEAGRELMTYIVRCALPEGTTLTATVNFATYTFPGLLGLAPQWLSEALGPKEQRWVSACLLAHVNGYGVSVPLSVRGQNPVLGTTVVERSAYMKQELSFYGNVFVPTDKVDDIGDIGHRMYACGGAALVAECGTGTSAFAPSRTCGTNTNCEVKFTGPCNEPNGTHYACEKPEGEGYTKCHAEQSTAVNKWSKGTAYAEIITVYLMPAEFEAMYPTCTLP